MLVWDHDRLWGEFNFGIYFGILLSDPRPGPENLPARSSSRNLMWIRDRSCAFEWRGMRTDDPGLGYGGDGVLTFKENEGFSGYFDGFRGVGIHSGNPKGRCQFEAIVPARARNRMVARSIDYMVWAWNCYRVQGEEVEERRQAEVQGLSDEEWADRRKEEDEGGDEESNEEGDRMKKKKRRMRNFRHS
jgi:hypothetical protein